MNVSASVVFCLFADVYCCCCGLLCIGVCNCLAVLSVEEREESE